MCERTTIILNGQHFSAPASAVKVLRRFRSRSRTLIFWIDALSINQTDPDERGAHVAMMGCIFEHAVRTRIWLGDETSDTNLVLRTIRSIARQMQPNPEEPGLSMLKDLSARASGVTGLVSGDATRLYSFFERRWFSRVLVVQEAVLSRSCKCFVGDYTLQWSHVMLAATWAFLGKGFWRTVTSRRSCDYCHLMARIHLLSVDRSGSHATKPRRTTQLASVYDRRPGRVGYKG